MTKYNSFECIVCETDLNESVKAHGGSRLRDNVLYSRDHSTPLDHLPCAVRPKLHSFALGPSPFVGVDCLEALSFDITDLPMRARVDLDGSFAGVSGEIGIATGKSISLESFALLNGG
jgi:hypothetical protein